MGIAVGQADCLELCLSEAATSILCGPSTLSIPAAVALRSKLISDLREQRDGDVLLPLPLGKGDAEAWLQFATGQSDARHIAGAAHGHDALNGCLTDSQVELGSSGVIEEVDLLCRALKVRCAVHTGAMTGGAQLQNRTPLDEPIACYQCMAGMERECCHLATRHSANCMLWHRLMYVATTCTPESPAAIVAMNDSLVMAFSFK